MRFLAVSLILASFSAPAFGNVEVRFVESAPRDRFTVTNTGQCDLLAIKVTIDLSGSPYGLVFDVTNRGAGFNVSQPFRVAYGADYLATQPTVLDGDNAVTLDLVGLPAGESFGFTIDVDDTRPNLPTRVSAQEILGAEITVELTANTVTAAFDRDGRAVAPLSACLS